MSRVSSERRLWQCPGCGRSYRIPAGAESPRLCPECVAGEATVALSAPAAKPEESAIGRLPIAADSAAGVIPGGSVSFQAESSATQALQNIASHLESISRSMRAVRRMVWGVLISSVLMMLICGYAGLRMMQTFGGTSLDDLQRQLGGESGGEGGVNDLLEPIRRLQQESQRAQDFLREAEGR